jgi:uncharacterized membrane protein YhaH (DUF805 family)
MESYVKAIKNYANFRGRTRRSDFWYYILFYAIFYIAAALIDFLFLSTSLNSLNWLEALEDFDISNMGGFYFPIFSTTFAFFSILPTVSATVRRLHDIGYSGGYYFVPFVTTIYFTITIAGAIVSSLWIIPLLIYLGVLIWYIVLLATDSQSGPNEYGPNPKEATVETSVRVKQSEYVYAAASQAPVPPTATATSFSPTSAPTVQNIPEDDDFLFNKCLNLIQNEEYAEANNLISRALQVDPGNAKYKKLAVLIEDKVARNKQLYELYKKAEESYYQGNLADAYAYANKLIQLDSHPNSIELQQKIERAYNSESEIRSLKSAIQSYINAGDYRNAEKAINQIKTLTTDSEIENWSNTVKENIAMAEYEIALRFYNARDYKQAAINIENAFSRKPDNSQVLELKNKITTELSKVKNRTNTVIFVSVFVFIILLIFGVIAISRHREIKEAWNYALSENTRAAYNEFILKFPDTELSRLALSKIDSINKADNKAWSQAFSLGSYVLAEQYLKKYTDGLNVEKAERAIDSLLWVNYQKNPTKENVQLYLNSKYARKYVGKGEQDLDRLKRLIITESEKELYNTIISNYLQNISIKDYSALTNDFELIASQYYEVRKADKGKIINYHTSKRNIQREEFNLDPLSMEFKRDEKSTTVKFRTDYFVDRLDSDYYSANTNRYYEVRDYTFEFNENNRIIKVKSKTVTRTKIDN